MRAGRHMLYGSLYTVRPRGISCVHAYSRSSVKHFQLFRKGDIKWRGLSFTLYNTLILEVRNIVLLVSCSRVRECQRGVNEFPSSRLYFNCDLKNMWSPKQCTFTTSRPEARTSEPEESLVRVQVGRNDDIEDQYGNHSRIADDLYQPGPCIPNRTRQQHHLFGCNKFTVELHFRSLLSGVGGFSNASDSRSPFLEENISAACMYYLGARYRVHPYTAGMFFVPFFLSRIGLYGIHPQLL